MNFFQNLVSCRVLPVIIARDVESTVHLAQSLQRGGMRAVEITLRTPAALDSLREVKSALPGLLVAAGTVTSPASLQMALDAGVDFCVSPGITEALLRAANEQGAQLLPGVASASEVMLGVDLGYEVFKPGAQLLERAGLGGAGGRRTNAQVVGGSIPGGALLSHRWSEQK